MPKREGRVSLLHISNTRKIVSCIFFAIAIITAPFLILPPLFGENGFFQPFAYFGTLLTDFFDFFAYLIPVYCFAEGLLILFRKAGSNRGKLLLFSLCPLSLLSVFVQLSGGRAPVLAARLSDGDDHFKLTTVTIVVFLALAAEIVLFAYYAVLQIRNRPVRTKKIPTANPLTDGIEYGHKPKTLSERLKTLRHAWHNFLTPDNAAPAGDSSESFYEDDTESDSRSAAPENEPRRPTLNSLKSLFTGTEEKPGLRSMDTISYPYPEDRPRFNDTPMPAPGYTRFESAEDACNRTPGAASAVGADENGDRDDEFGTWEPESDEETLISVPDDDAPFDTGFENETDTDDEFYGEEAFDTDETETAALPGTRTATSAAPAGRSAAVSGSAAAVRRKRPAGYKPPSKDLLTQHQETQYWIIDEDTKEAAEILRRTLEEFGIQAQVTGITRGPVVTMFELLPAPGVKLSKIANLADNIALRLAAGRVRIVAPIPGKHAVGIEVPNRKRALVSFKELIEDPAFKKSTAAIPVILGKDITGETQVIDLTSTPHLLIAGSTGSGKSVCVNSIITSVLYKKSPDEVRMILIDPKIVELKMYNDIPHLLTPVITDAKRAYMALQYGLTEMERRYNLLDALGARNIESYNKKAKESGMTAPHLPYILIVIDEFADLMAANRKDLEQAIARLAAMSRAVGIHLILATQRPSVDVITGLIKANIPSRIAFMTASKIDSRTILDTVGAEKLLGKGDMLYVSSTNPYPTRIQGTFLSEHEVETVTDYVKSLGEPDYLDDEIFMDETEILEDNGDDDPLFDEALQIVVQTGKASASYLQRRLQVGYNRAARMIETMEARGYIGPQNGSKPREVLVTPDRI